MRSFIFSIALFGICIAAIADEFRDFRVPNNRVVQTNIRFNTWLRRVSTGNEYPNGANSTNLEQDGSASLYHYLRTESERQTTSITLSGNLSESASRQKSNTSDISDDYTSDYLNRSYEFGANAYADVNRSWYMRKDLFAITGDMNGRASYRSSGGDSKYYSRLWHYYYGNVEQWRYQESESWQQNYDFALRVGPTIGRVRNVTAVADVLVMEQRLIEEGVLTGRLTNANRQALAEIIYQRDTYRGRNGRYQKYYWRDIEQVIARDSARERALDAYTLQRMSESYLGSITRYRGFAITPQISYNHGNYINHYWEYYVTQLIGDSVYEYSVNDNYSSYHSHGDNMTYGVRLSYHAPFGLAWQYGLSSHFQHNPQTNNFWAPHTQSWDADIATSLSWIMADRWYSRAVLQFYSSFDDEVGDDTYKRETVSATLMLDVNYLIEDRVSAYAELSDGYSWGQSRYWHLGSPVTSRGSRRTTEFRIGMTYALRGPIDYYYYPY